MNDSLDTFYKKVENTSKLIEKHNIPGFVVGLSGTDSILSFMICYHAIKIQPNQNVKLIGVHYQPVLEEDRWFIEEIIPFFNRYDEDIVIEVPLVSPRINSYDMWSNLIRRSLDEKLLVVSSKNLTEQYLGTYSNAMRMASFEPISDIYKSEVISLCRELTIPKVAIEKSMMPDCACGRDQLQALFPELTDEIIKFRKGIHKTTQRLEKFDPYWVEQVEKFVDETHEKYNYKNEIPYKV